MELFIQQLVSGISIGAIYSLLAVGYALVYSVYNFTNWAFDGFHGLWRFHGLYRHHFLFHALLAGRDHFDHSHHSFSR